MQAEKTFIEGLLVIKPAVFEDKRGYFFESYNEKILQRSGLDTRFVQDNQSLSQKNVLRGLHFQSPPHAQGKLVRVIKGSVLDVVVDIRKRSPTYGKHFSLELNEQNKTMLWVPEGFAHGFVTLQDETIFYYKCNNYYNKESEGCVKWDDPSLGIDWHVSEPVLSDKDLSGTPFADFVSPF